ncbi:MAG: gliding motility-associated C-terminal domain-containing protein [Bacteroidota bacterium]
MRFIKHQLLVLLLVIPTFLCAQEIELFQQLNGRYDYLSFGNTLNLRENGGINLPCEILTVSSADFELEADQTLVAAYLYWAGSGSGDFEVVFNGNPLVAERTFSYTLPVSGSEYFGAMIEVTSIVSDFGNGTYSLSELDLTEAIQPFCQINGGNATNFGGWAVTVVYQDDDLPLNQVNIFDGFEAVSAANSQLDIELNNLNVLDNIGAKLGFLAWEGDLGIANNETLQINGNILSNALNPADNQFNGTNSFTNNSEFYNMDIDFYDIENNIQPGDESALVRITSSQDLVIINNVVSVLNTELPDATVKIDLITGATECGDREITGLDYTVFNVNSTAVLPAGTRVGFYAQNLLMDTAFTQTDLPIGGSESGSIALTIPAQIPADFELRAFVDDNEMVTEANEDNNEDIVDFHLAVFPDIVDLRNLELCDVVGLELFDLTEATAGLDPNDSFSFHLTEDDANNDVNPITNPESYENITNPQVIWVRAFNPDCFVVGSFEIEVIICPLPDATISIDNEIYACRQRDLTIDYTVYNLKGTAPLPGGTPIAFYADGDLIGRSQTQSTIPEGGSESGSIDIELSEDIPNMFVLLAVVDDDGSGLGIIQELNEFNNEFEIAAEFGTIPPIANLPDLLECDLGLDTALFDLTVQNELISTDPNDMISYFTTLENAIANTNAISDPEQYENAADPQTIFVRLENEICFTTASFLLTTENCKPIITQGVSPNGDTLNDEFIITGLIDVFLDFNLKIYSREGNLIYEGGNDDGLWDAIPNTGLLVQNKVVPVGTYYYVLVLNDPEFPDAFLGYLYVNY